MTSDGDGDGAWDGDDMIVRLWAGDRDGFNEMAMEMEIEMEMEMEMTRDVDFHTYVS